MVGVDKMVERGYVDPKTAARKAIVCPIVQRREDPPPLRR